MEVLRPVPASRHVQPSSFVYKDLATATHVLLRDDTVRRPLQPPYSGPHRILKRRDKTLTLALNGRESTVSVDRVKPAHIESGILLSSNASYTPPLPAPASPTVVSRPPVPSQAPVPPPAPVTTRTGRKVKFRDVLNL